MVKINQIGKTSSDTLFRRLLIVLSAAVLGTVVFGTQTTSYRPFRQPVAPVLEMPELYELPPLIVGQPPFQAEIFVEPQSRHDLQRLRRQQGIVKTLIKRQMLPYSNVDMSVPSRQEAFRLTLMQKLNGLFKIRNVYINWSGL